MGTPLIGFHDALFLADEFPNFIALNGVAANAVHLLLHDLFALRADLHQELHDGFLMNASHTDNGADRTAFGESRDNRELLFGLQYVHGTSLDGDPGRCILQTALTGAIRFDLRGTYRVAAARCYKHRTANFQNDGVGGQLRTGNGRISNPLFYPLELPRHSSSFRKFPPTNFLVDIVIHKSLPCVNRKFTYRNAKVYWWTMKRRTQEIRQLILREIDDVGKVSPSKMSKTFKVSRQAIFKNVQELVASGVIIKTDIPKFPYRIKPLQNASITVSVSPEVEENKIWNDSIGPILTGLKDNVREICHYGFTEIFNNVIDHSASQSADILATIDALVVHITIQDYGVGIWKKLQGAFHLDDPRHALLELTKGKLTTDPQRHTGEGIFFTSRMFDKFIIASDKLTFCRFQEGDEWLFDIKEDNAGPGTRVSLTIYLESERTPREVFDKFTAELDDFGFTRTQLSVQLAKYEGDHLVSRSQAKRLLARLDKFKEVYLDFRDVTEIGQAFADEIFRVFQTEHRTTRLIPVNIRPEVQKMISRAQAQTNETESPT
jgi:anti-sigma regulatory factor (Ser/Thr protein kinase)